MRKPLVVGCRGDHLQAIESSRTQAAAETFVRIVALLGHPQAIELLDPQVAAKPYLYRYVIDLSASH